MDFVKLNNGVEMPILGFGTFQTQGEECEKSILNAIKSGYRLLDTAEAYGNEEAVGNAIAKCGISRRELFITTKVNFKSYDNTRTAVENSMRKLQTEYLDLVLLHWPFGNVYSACRDLENLYEEGKIRAIGVSNFEPDRLIDLISFNRVKPVVNQIETHIYCQRHMEHKWEDKYGKTPAQISLRFLLQNNVVIIPKSVHENRIKENIDLFDFELTLNEMAAINALDKKTAMIGNPETLELVEAAMKW